MVSVRERNPICPTPLIGGFRENGEAVTTYQSLKRILANMLEEVQVPQNVDFVIRETSRKNQHAQAQLTIWRRKMIRIKRPSLIQN